MRRTRATFPQYVLTILRLTPLRPLSVMSKEELRQHLQDILDNTRLLTLLQPILDLAGGRMMGYELSLIHI